MGVMISAKDAAASWGITTRAVTTLCRAGKIPGAKKENRTWKLPADAERPVDHRFKEKTSGMATRARKVKLPLPIGVSDYCEASEEYYYVDKTLMIRDLLDERSKVALFTRPRRFGKTLNMDMLRTFFEKSEKDTSIYFKNKKIWKSGKAYQEHQGKYPVIFLTFKDVKWDNWIDTYEHIGRLIGEEFRRHSCLQDSEQCDEYEKRYYNRIVSGEAGMMDYVSSLKELSKMLCKHYGEPSIIIIDEYDTPIQQGHLRGFYDEVVSFMRNFFSSGLKDNKNLTYGFLTGILRVAKESIFSGLNNLMVNSVLDKKYSEYFGFTKAEVAEMANYYGASDKMQELCDWYDGYRFGDTEIFNPWSVINYFSSGCEPRAYWLSTSNNDIIGEILRQADQTICEQLVALLQGEAIFTCIDTSVIYPQIQKKPASIYSFLLVCGYLKVVEQSEPSGTGMMCRVALPNKEIRFVYQSEILDKMSELIPQASAIGIQEAIYMGNVEALRDRLGHLLKTSVSYYDTAKESFYNGLMLGLLAMTDDRYRESSNGESGDGRFDICLIPKQQNLPGILIELKAEKKCTKEELEKRARDAIHQIEEKHYDEKLRLEGVTNILKYGVAFSGKEVAISTSTQ